MTNDTMSIKALVTLVAVSALNLTTTVNNTGMTYAYPSAVISNTKENDMGTSTLMPMVYETIEQKSGYEQARKLFSDEMRDFTENEAIAYQESLEKIYRPIGVSIFNLC